MSKSSNKLDFGSSSVDKHEPMALSSSALFGKSQVYARRSLMSKVAGDNELYQMWAALALELLAKASLSRIHPCLIVDTANTNSILEACGFNTNTAVRTIDANTVFARLKHTVPGFGSPNSEACRKISARRNSELHSGQAAFSAMQLDVWEGEFWRASQLILRSMTLELDDWVGAESDTPEALLKHLRDIHVQTARQTVSDYKSSFTKDHARKESEALKLKSKHLFSYSFLNKFRFPTAYHWREECPACGCEGFLGGDLIDEEVIDQDYSDGYEKVIQYYSPIEFFCPTCQLQLLGEDALNGAGLSDDINFEVEREIEYEPDYGND